MRERQIQAHVYVSGQVQGVSYRAMTSKAAQKLNLRGWVRNLPDGRVEAVFTGTETSVQAMLGWCRRGPLHSLVQDVQVLPQPIEAFAGFDVRSTPVAGNDETETP
ncbi:MAG: acylphosphatase [Myxococcales bacterium]|nr:acylphosphatase [Myxococcales bacterium]